MSENIVSDDQVCMFPAGGKVAGGAFAKEAHLSRNSTLLRFFGDIRCGLDAQYGDVFCDKVLEQVTVIAGDFHNLALGVQSESFRYSLGILPGVRQPTVRKRGEIRVVGKDLFRLGLLLELDQ